MAKLRLKTKLVLAISGMAMALVIVFSSIYVLQIVRQRIQDIYENGDFVAHEIFYATHQALEVDLTSTQVDTSNPQSVRAATEEILQTDPGLNSLMQSIVGYSRPIYDAAIADPDGHALLHTDPTFGLKRTPLDTRDNFRVVRDGSFRRQLAVVYGPPKVYEITLPIERNGVPFASVRVGISTVFLKSELQPQINRALAFSSAAILLTFILAAGLSNAALRPLVMISRRLDLMTGDAIAATPEPARGDEVGMVNTKINRLGQQMRDVKEIFTALKDNLDQIMANLQDGLILFTRDSKAILVSAAVENFLGMSRENMLGHHVEEFLSPGTTLGKVLLDSFNSHAPVAQREVEMESGRRVLVSLDFIEEGGERIGALLTLRDAETVRRIEDEIELSHRLANIGRLASGVGHEVKNPINAIVVHLELLRQKLQQVDPTTRRHMDVIGSEIQRLDRVVQMLVDFTRPVELRLTDLDARKLLEDVATLASPDAARHGVRIERQLPAVPLVVRADSDLLKQAFLNVVLNGVQAMPRGGTLNIRGSRHDDEVLIEVSDEGSGIPPEIRDKIYNLYFTTKKTGTGIGLAMTYKVMQLHHGSVDFDSANGSGTTFRLRLPALPAATEAQRELAAKKT
jgi:PAS domain S-box-containing protein